MDCISCSSTTLAQKNPKKMDEDQILTQTEANNMSMADQGRRPRKKNPMTLHTVEFPVSNINPI